MYRYSRALKHGGAILTTPGIAGVSLHGVAGFYQSKPIREIGWLNLAIQLVRTHVTFAPRQRLLPANAGHNIYNYSNQMNTKSLTIGTVCFLINEKNNKILILERSRQPMKNMITGVGGKTDFDEDIYSSCLREIKEETGFEVRNLKFRGVIKTIIESLDNSWILFIYTAREFSGQQIDCPEGRLIWVDRSELLNQNLIGFIREIVPYILDDKTIEGTIIHDQSGNVLKSNIRVTD